MRNYIFLSIVLSLVVVACSGETPTMPTPPPTPPLPTKQAVNMWGIDMTPLEINGKYYAIWSGWNKYYDNMEGDGQYLYIASMTFHTDKPKVRLGQRVLLSVAELDWELKVNEGFSLLEGPTVLKHNDDVFVLYSTRGSWTINYKMGQLKLKNKSSDPLDPKSWIKKSSPVFQGVKQDQGLGYIVFGVGHASFIMSPDGTENWMNYHSKTSIALGWDDRKVYFQRFTFDQNGDPEMGIAANSAEAMTRPSGEVEIDKGDGIAEPSATFMNPVREGADPWIVFKDGKYYTCRSHQRAIWVTESRFMTKFEDANQQECTYEQARKKAWIPPAQSTNMWNMAQIWAPELHFINGRWHIFYSAGRQQAAPYWEERAGVLISTSDSPFGPYEQHDDQPLFTGELQ